MRIAQFTMTGYFNYGNMLQKFALQHTLKKFADFVEIIWDTNRTFFSETGSKPVAQCVINKRRRDWEKKFSRFEAVRQSKFKDFENLHIPTRFNIPYLEDIADEYDFFVIGSDQVWNPNWNKPYCFFDFVPHEKKIAYAASIGAPAIPDEKKEFFRRGISDFNYVSVREENAANIINDLTGQRPPVLLDPALLLTEKEWLSVAQKPTWFKEKYSRGFVLTYYLRNLPPPQIKTLATELDLPVINLLDTENYNHFTVGPAEFVWLFANASLIFTNSFHGLAFSILFKRPFIDLEISGDKKGVSMSSRITSLLKLFGLENRIKIPDEPLNIDFTRREEVLPLERARAFKFLSEALLKSSEPIANQWGGASNSIFVNLPLICLLVTLLCVQIKFFGRL